MKHFLLILCGLLSTASWAAEAELSPGATTAEIFAQMGAPDSLMELPGKTILLYERAELTVVDGTLVEAEFRTAEAVALENLQKAKAAEAWAEYQEQLRLERMTRGQALLERKGQDAAFKAQPGRQQARFWRDFIRDYPEVEAAAEYAAAVELAQAEAEAYQARRQTLAATQVESDRPATAALIDTVEVGSGYGLPCYGYNSSPSVVIVNPGGSTVSYPHTASGYRRPLLDVAYRSDNFGIRYTAGGGSSYGQPCSTPPRQPIVIVNP